MGFVMTQITVAALQLAFSDDIDANIANVSRLVREAASRGGQVVLPPELFEGESDEEPRLVRVISAGKTAQIQPGQWLVEQPSDIHQAANRGSSPVVIYLATLLKDGAAPSTPVDLHPPAAH